MPQNTQKLYINCRILFLGGGVFYFFLQKYFLNIPALTVFEIFRITLIDFYLRNLRIHKNGIDAN